MTREEIIQAGIAFANYSETIKEAFHQIGRQITTEEALEKVFVFAFKSANNNGSESLDLKAILENMTMEKKNGN